ncbi:MAG: glycosyltransferase family 39 protein [Planctomycetes bacterium]|nr:glycosyltransferase family 39 protein [Planctomycetota bacterium]
MPLNLKERLLRPAAFALFITIIWTALWLGTASRSHYWEQVAAWDWSNYGSSALVMKHTIEEKGPGGIVDAWIYTSGAHTPFLQLCSAMLMFVFGESRFVCESVLIIFTFLFAWSTLKVIELLYDPPTARWSLILYFCFPVLIFVSNVYLLEHPMAAFFSLSMWMMIKSGGFRRWGPSLLFGVFAGLACVTRLMSFVYYVGPAVVGFVWIARGPDKLNSYLKFVVAGAVALGIAATWYVPNYSAIKAYVGGVTFGGRAKAFTGGNSPISLDTVFYYFTCIVNEAPGFPLAVILAAGGAALVIYRKLPRIRGGPMSIMIVLAALDFLVIFPSGQRVGARYFLPLMPIVAILMVRTIQLTPWAAWRAILILLTAANAAFHLLSLTIFLQVPMPESNGPTPLLFGVQLWNHRPLFLGMASAVDMEPGMDLRAPEIVARIEEAHSADSDRIFVMSDHPFIQVHSIKFESLLQKKHWTFGAAETLQLWDGPEFDEAVVREAKAYEILVVRTGGYNYGTFRSFGDIAKRAAGSGRVRFREIGDAIYLGDGSLVRVYNRRPTFGFTNNLSEIENPMDVAFEGKGETIRVVGMKATAVENVVRFCYWLRFDAPIARRPIHFMHILNANNSDDILAGTSGTRPVPIDAKMWKGAGPWYYYFEFELFVDSIRGNDRMSVPIKAAFGFLYGDPMGVGAPPERLMIKNAEGDARFDNNGTRLLSQTFTVGQIVESTASAPAK